MEGRHGSYQQIVHDGSDHTVFPAVLVGKPELYVKLFELVKAGDLKTALEIQNDCCRIIYKLCSGHGNMYGMIKEALRKMGCPDCGSVRAPLAELIESDYAIVDESVAMIQEAIAKYC